jgi:hypothetical protein
MVIDQYHILLFGVSDAPLEHRRLSWGREDGSQKFHCKALFEANEREQENRGTL